MNLSLAFGDDKEIALRLQSQWESICTPSPRVSLSASDDRRVRGRSSEGMYTKKTKVPATLEKFRSDHALSHPTQVLP
jgi:hypothetical protein